LWQLLLQMLNYEELAKFSSKCKEGVHLYSFVEHFSGFFFLLAVCIHDISTRLRHYVVTEGGCNWYLLNIINIFLYKKKVILSRKLICQNMSQISNADTWWRCQNSNLNE
jgi:hypothetical protein